MNCSTITNYMSLQIFLPWTTPRSNEPSPVRFSPLIAPQFLSVWWLFHLLPRCDHESYSYHDRPTLIGAGPTAHTRWSTPTTVIILLLQKPHKTELLVSIYPHPHEGGHV